MATLIGNVLRLNDSSYCTLWRYIDFFNWWFWLKTMGIVVLVPCTNLYVHLFTDRRYWPQVCFLYVFVSIYCKMCNKDHLIKGESVDLWISGSCRALIQWVGYKKSECRHFVHNEWRHVKCSNEKGVSDIGLIYLFKRLSTIKLKWHLGLKYCQDCWVVFQETDSRLVPTCRNSLF